MEATAARSHHAGVRKVRNAPECPTAQCSPCAALSLCAVLLCVAVWLRVDDPHRSSAKRLDAQEQLCAMLESDITCARSMITRVAAPPPLLQPPPPHSPPPAPLH